LYKSFTPGVFSNLVMVGCDANGKPFPGNFPALIFRIVPPRNLSQSLASSYPAIIDDDFPS
jgi:hypothetical protein